MFRKYLDYGGNPNLKIHFYATEESNRDDYKMTVEQFIKTEGSYKSFKINYMKNNLSIEGKELIQFLTDLTKLYNTYITTQRKELVSDNLLKLSQKFSKFIGDTYFYGRNRMMVDVYFKFYENMRKYIADNDLKSLTDLIFSHNGIKNYIHIKIKEKNKDAENLFWDLKKADIEFKKLSNM
jgi:hypothetical protein